jgi:pilus assembly protein CpaB
VRVRAAAALLAAALAVTAVLVGSGRSPHGPPVPVVVAARDLPAGHELAPDDLVRRRWPRDLVPDGAAAQVGAGGTLLGPVPAGTPVAPSMIADAGVAGMVGDGFAVVGLPVSLLPPESLGASLDLVAPGPDGTPRVLTRAARVLTSDEQHAWLEVVEEDAAEVASAGRAEALVVVLRAP